MPNCDSYLVRNLVGRRLSQVVLSPRRGKPFALSFVVCEKSWPVDPEQTITIEQFPPDNRRWSNGIMSPQTASIAHHRGRKSRGTMAAERPKPRTRLL